MGRHPLRVQKEPLFFANKKVLKPYFIIETKLSFYRVKTILRIQKAEINQGICLAGSRDPAEIVRPPRSTKDRLWFGDFRLKSLN